MALIVVKILGGLGNQMFQYAFGRAVSSRLGRPLVLDLSSMPTGRFPHVREYELSRLPIAPVKTIGVVKFSNRRDIRQCVRWLYRGAQKGLLRYRILDNQHEDGCVAHVPWPIAHFVGYWQSPLYFESIAEEVRMELRPRLDSLTAIEGLLLRYQHRETVMVHVRRGDYVGSQVHPTLGVDYYRSAVEAVADGLPDPLAVVFSDDPRWAMRHLDLGIETVHAEEHFTLDPIETLGAMAATRHHVIANSSLSWWGAYLAEHATQRVRYPTHWFAHRSVNPEVRFPNHWLPHAVE